MRLFHLAQMAQQMAPNKEISQGISDVSSPHQP